MKVVECPELVEGPEVLWPPTALGLRPRNMNMFQHAAIECPELVEGQCCVYILECSDNSYYVGSTTNMQERLLRHERKDASLWTTVRAPVILVYTELHSSHIEARRREFQLKRWTRVKKERLISGEWRKQ